MIGRVPAYLQKMKWPVGAAPQFPHARPAAHAKARPDFGLLLFIHPNGIVRGRGPLVGSLRPGLVGADAGVNHYALTTERKFVTQHVAVSVARLIIRPERTAIEDEPASSSSALRMTP